MSDLNAENRESPESRGVNTPPTAPQPQQMQIPIPAVPLPLNLFFGIVKTQEGEPVIIMTAVNDSGSMVQGILSVEAAAKIGRDLMGAARSAQVQAPKKLVVPGGLALPA